MGTCPNCGRSAWLLRKIPCKICGKTTCDRCALYAFKIVTFGAVDSWYVCSKRCMNTLLGKFVEKITPNVVPIEFSILDVPNMALHVLKSQKNEQLLSKYIASLSTESRVSFENDFSNKYLSHEYSNMFYEGLARHIALTRVQNLITAGRFEDAAEGYERLHMIEEAGKVRARKSEIKIRRTEVSVDLNSLLRELKEGGIVVVYRCPHCGGNFRIGKDASVESLKQCVHCGSKIETMDIASFLRTALS